MFFVDEEYPIEGLKNLIVKILGFWGGRTSPIVPVKNGVVTPEWRKLLNFYDPDYCYYSNGVNMDFLKELCDEYRLNPIESYELDDRCSDVHGVHYANIMPLLPKMCLPNVYNLAGVETPLYDYYRINFFVDDTLPVNKHYYSHIKNEWLFKGHELLLINNGSFSLVNNKLAGASNITTLSAANSSEGRLRSAIAEYHGFEMVIARDSGGFEELIYHWNKELYDIPSRAVLTLFLHESDLIQLTADKHFREVIKSLSGQDHMVKLVTFSLSDEYVSKTVEQLNSYSNLNIFAQKKVENFPYPILDKRKGEPAQNFEHETVQVLFNNQSFIFLPKLSFQLEYTPNTPLYACDISIVDSNGPFSRSLRFPPKFNSDVMLQTASRINRTRQLSFAVTLDLHDGGKLNFKVWDFFDIVGASVTTPKITGSRDIKNVFKRVGYSDSSNRLAHFLKLFNDDFIFLQDYLHDKFWNDLFLELTTSSKSEGDTITFQDLFGRCYSILVEEGQEFTSKEDGRFNEENLGLGLKSMIQTLCEHKVFMPGFVIKCKHCSSKIWYSIDESKEKLICKGCSSTNHFKAENPIAYKLNSLVKNNYGTKSAKGIFLPDGNMTAVRTLLHIWNKAINGFLYIPQIDIFDCAEGHKPFTDLDIVAISSGDFYIGECKHSSDLFFDSGNKALLNMVKIAAIVKPDFVILSCTNDVNGKLEKAAKFLRHHMINWKYKPEIVPYITWAPDYFGTHKSEYFYY
jgi:hypothetical protein